jgi:ATP-binding cassette subfamily G (WHITE) protein 2
VKYTYVAIATNELSGLTLTCTPAEVAASKCITSGETTIQTLGLSQYSIPLCAGVLVVYIIVCRFMAYLGLRLLKW